MNWVSNLKVGLESWLLSLFLGEGANILAKFLLILSEDGILNSQILPELLTLLESDEFIEKPQLFVSLIIAIITVFVVEIG